MRTVIPLKQRPMDFIYLGFFLFNLIFVSYNISLEQIVISDPGDFTYPVWPLPFMIDIVHWWETNFDPLLWARPPWYKATIWLDAIVFGPYYIAAIYAFIKGREWIRIPTFIYSSIMFTNVVIICSEEIWGPHASPAVASVLAANASWFIFPVFLVWKMWKQEHPFSR
ncbi:MAG: emopamil-binding family protein [Bacteroidetes bacterium]|nr:emopamil-binding family protein [Bacteroidota bacterium]